MKQPLVGFASACIAMLALASGCASHKPKEDPQDAITHYQQVATQIETPAEPAPSDPSLAHIPGPSDLRNPGPVQYWDLSLLDVMHSALANARVLQDLGGTLLRAPESVPTTYWVATQETDPQYGPEAALSAFDTQFTTSLFFQKNQQQYNNRLIGINGFLSQEYDNFEAALSKRAVTGDQFTLRHSVDFNGDNNLGNQFQGGVWDTVVEAEVRHPFLQGAGIDFNRIAGPGAKPGTFNGVLIARLKTDVTLTDFSIGVRDFVANLENAYWDLYFAYRDLDTKIKARDEALETWRNINALHLAKRRGGEDDKEAQARELYFQFEEEVQNALVGRELEATRTYNGSTPGTFRGQPGVRTAERKLRLLMGLPATDGRLIRPSDEPPVCNITFDWSELSCEALCQREELRRQRWIVKAREMELSASHNFLQPNLDLVARYGMRGYGFNLLDTNRPPGASFDSAYRSLVDGDYPEWQAGLEFSMPLGFRDAHAGVRNAELRLTQSRAVLREQELQVINNLTGSVDQVNRAFLVLQTSINRAVAARDQLKALRVAYELDKAELFVVLDAHRRYADAMSNYYQSRVEYALAIRNVHFEKGSLLEYCDIALAEGPWPAKAYRDAAQRERLRGRSRRIDFTLRRPPVVSQGPAAQATGSNSISAGTPPSGEIPAVPAAPPMREKEMLDAAPQPPSASGTPRPASKAVIADPGNAPAAATDRSAGYRTPPLPNPQVLDDLDRARTCSWQPPAAYPPGQPAIAPDHFRTELQPAVFTEPVDSRTPNGQPNLPRR